MRSSIFSPLGLHVPTNIIAVKDGIVKTVFCTEKDNVPAFSKEGDGI
jgi:hypothetical protein